VRLNFSPRGWESVSSKVNCITDDFVGGREGEMTMDDGRRLHHCSLVFKNFEANMNVFAASQAQMVGNELADSPSENLDGRTSRRQRRSATEPTTIFSFNCSG
jgi:hypothetical protein